MLSAGYPLVLGLKKKLQAKGSSKCNSMFPMLRSSVRLRSDVTQRSVKMGQRERLEKFMRPS